MQSTTAADTQCDKLKGNFCHCDECRTSKADEWFVCSQRPMLFPLCKQFKKAYLDDDDAAMFELQLFFEQARCVCCGCTILHLAVSVASKESVSRCLERNLDIEMKNDNGETALHLACVLDDSWFVEQLLTNKANVNAVDEVGCTPLQICLSRQATPTSILRVLLDHGARPNNFFDFEKDDGESIDRMVKVNMKNSAGIFPLYEAVYNGNHDEVRRLLEDGACPNSLNCYRRSLLQVACFNQSVDCVEALLDAGLDVNESDLDGSTALHYAVIGNNVEIVKLLATHKCNLWLRDSCGYTAFGIAVLTNRLEVTNELLVQGAGCTEALLVKALECRCTDAVLAILRHCRFRLDVGNLGRNLLYYAVATGQQMVVDHLQFLGVEVAYEGSEDEDLLYCPRKFASKIVSGGFGLRRTNGCSIKYFQETSVFQDKDCQKSKNDSKYKLQIQTIGKFNRFDLGKTRKSVSSSVRIPIERNSSCKLDKENRPKLSEVSAPVKDSTIACSVKTFFQTFAKPRLNDSKLIVKTSNCKEMMTSTLTVDTFFKLYKLGVA